MVTCEPSKLFLSVRIRLAAPKDGDYEKFKNTSFYFFDSSVGIFYGVV